jgi:Putative metal-binding motif
MNAPRVALLTLSLVLAACAAGSVPSSGFDGTPGTEGGVVSPDSGDDLRGRTEGGPPPESGAPDAPPGAADKDGDGHCPPGASDPAGSCKSFNDCDDGDKARHPGALETCADVGTDNDCDGQSGDVDEDGDGKDDLKTPCDTGLPGACQPGTRQCSGGKLVCAGTFQVGQKSESCNGDDDDCDGSTDEGALCSGGNTCAGAAGCRCGSAAPCSGAQQCCPAGCFDLQTSAQACGACGVACGANETCSGGACRCGATTGAVGGGPACPGASCNGSVCATCNPSTNLALSATASSSGGGYTTGHGPTEMNNGQLQSSCNFHWVTATSTPAGKWVQYVWAQPMTFNQIWFDTAPSSGVCSMSAGRSLAGGTVQIWSGVGWTGVGSVAGKSTDWSFSFTKVTTSKLRLYDLVAINTGYAKNPMIFEWRVFCN